MIRELILCGISDNTRKIYSIVIGILFLFVANTPNTYFAKCFYVGVNSGIRYTYFLYVMDFIGLFFIRFGLIKTFFSNLMWIIYVSILSISMLLVAFVFIFYVIKWNVFIGILGSLFFYIGVVWYTYEIGQVCARLLGDRR